MVRMTLEMRTPLARALGIDHPIFSVGFGDGAGPELVAAVSGAGACGVLGGSGYPPDDLRERIARVRELTDRPFGVNFIIAALDRVDVPEESKTARREAISAALQARVPVIVLFWGDPAPFVDDARRAGVKVFVQVGSVEEARTAAASGVDAVILQGIEAGGHVRATESIWETLPAAVEALGDVPVLASGGIGNGSGIARALRLGAQGVSLGTRFVASEEAWIHDHYKRRVTGAAATDTFYGQLFDIGWPDAPHRALRNKTYEEWEAAGRPPPGGRPGEGTYIGVFRMPGGEEEPWLRYESGMLSPEFEGDPEYAPMWAGESCDVVNEIRPAADIVRSLVAETEAARTS
jgi:nitronate monooxygenase